jgi:hypothetical protein
MKPGILGSTFDLDFENFVTPKLAAVFYLLTLIAGAGAVVLLDVVTLLNLNRFDALPWQRRGADGWEFWVVCVSPLLYLLGVLWTRIVFETVVVFFRIAERLERR